MCGCGLTVLSSKYTVFEKKSIPIVGYVETDIHFQWRLRN